MEPKLPYLSIFELNFKKTIVMFDINTLKFVKNEFWTHRMNFGIESSFSKGPQCALFESPGVGVGQLYSYAFRF